MNKSAKIFTEQNSSFRAVSLKLGGCIAITGGIGYFLTLLFHGDLPDQTTVKALEYIAGRPEWRLLKLSLIISLLFWVASFEIFHKAEVDPASRLFARLAVIAGSIGVTIVIVEYSMIGYALKEIADKWTGLSGSEAATQLGMAGTILSISKGLFHSFIAWMIGTPFILMGIAVIKSQNYRTWFGWIAVILGSGVLTAGVTRFLGIDMIPYPVLYGGFIIPLTLWLATLGWFMWRNGKVLQKSDEKHRVTVEGL